MKRPLALTKLIHILDRLFDTVDLSKMIVTNAGIEDGTIAYSSASQINWTNIVNEALRQEALDRLVDAAGALREDARPELQALLRTYKTWSEHNAELVRELISDEKPPSLFDLFRVSILVWTTVLVVLFLAVGYCARTARYLLLGLPASVSAMLAPTEWIIGGVELLVRIPLMIFEYAGHGFGWLRVLLGIVMAGAMIYFLAVKRPPIVNRFYLPRIIIPLVVLGAGAKTWHYDIPTFAFKNVLTKNSITDAAFEIAPAYAREASSVWRSVVCTRIAGSDDPRARLWCGGLPAVEHRQNALGRFLMNVAWTTVLCSVAVAVIRKLARTSRRPEWNVAPTPTRMLITIAAIAGMLALLPAAQTYSRTVAPAEYDMVRPADGDEPFFRVCAGSTCFKFLPAFTALEESPGVAAAPSAGSEDILAACFEAQLDTLPVIPAL